MKRIIKYFTILFFSLTNRIISIICFFIPRKSDQMIFIGNNSKFIDNVKYFFLFKNQMNIKKYFLVYDKNEFLKLKNKLDNIIFFPSIKGFLILIRAKYTVVDNINWSTNLHGILYFLTKKSIKVQLWHGIPIKKIEYDNKTDPSIQRCKNVNSLKEGILLFINKQRCVTYDYLLIPSTSKNSKEIFYNAFDFRFELNVGYPRNEFLLYSNRFPGWKEFINNDKYILIENLKKNKKIILFLPTFRDNKTLFISLEDLKKLDLFAKKNDLIFVIKPHPWDDTLENFLIKNKFENIISLNRFEDIYPYLKLSDLLISDISSIIFDYLLLNKPIIHFFPDKENYMKHSRDLYFKLDDILCGPLGENIDELIFWIMKILIKNEDKYELIRDKIKIQIFGNIEHNSELIYKGIFNV